MIRARPSASITLQPPLRRARRGDAPDLVRLLDMAGRGLPSRLWAQAAAPGEGPFAFAQRRAERPDGSFSYRNACVVEAEGRVAGMLLGYRQPDPYEPGDLAALPDALRPLIELEAHAPGSWYISALAALPEFRGRGFGTRLLHLADALAHDSGAVRLSLIVAEENRNAFTWYQRNRFRSVARRPVVAIPGDPHTGDWLLMVKDLAG